MIEIVILTFVTAMIILFIAKHWKREEGVNIAKHWKREEGVIIYGDIDVPDQDSEDIFSTHCLECGITFETNGSEYHHYHCRYDECLFGITCADPDEVFNLMKRHERRSHYKRLD